MKNFRQLFSEPAFFPCDSGRSAGCWRRLFGLRTPALLLCVISAVWPVGEPLRAKPAASWTPIGPDAATVFCLARDPFTSTRLYAGTYFGGLYQSDDDGASWRIVPSPFSSFTIFSFAADPVVPGVLLVGTFGHGLYRSLDAGLTWEPVQGLETASPLDIAFVPGQPDAVVMATPTGVSRSSDGGVSWVPANSNPANLPAKCFACCPSQPGVVFVGTGGLGVYCSWDGGTNWASFSNGLGQAVVTGLAVDAQTGDVYASCYPGVFRLAAGATSWEDISFNLASVNVNQVLAGSDVGVLAATETGTYVLQTNAPMQWTLLTDKRSRLFLPGTVPGAYFLAEETGTLWYTDDGGQSFSNSNHGMQNHFVGALTTVNISNQTRLYAGTDFGVKYSTQPFRSSSVPPWTFAKQFPGAAFALASPAAGSNTVFAAFEQDGIWKGTDGTNWIHSSTGLVPQLVYSLSQSSGGNHTIFAGTSDGLYFSTNCGSSWSSSMATATPANVTSVINDPVRTGVVFYATSDGSVFRSFDEGNSFQSTWHSPGGEGIVQLAVAPFFNLYAVGASRTLYVSTDDGLGFTKASQITNEVLSVAANPVRPWIAYAGSVFGGVYRTTNSAITWEPQNDGLTIPIVYSLAVDATDDDIVYAGALGQVFRSTNSAVSWLPTGPGLPDNPVVHLEIDPDARGTILASVFGSGIYRSTNSGSTWSLLASGPAFDSGVPVIATHGTAESLLVGTRYSGVLRSDDGGSTWTNSSEGMSIFIHGLAIDPVAPETMYAGSLADGVFKSTNGGTSWVSKGVTERAIYGIAINPQNPAKVLLATSSGVVGSRDRGETWYEMGQQTAYVLGVINDPSNADHLYVAGAQGDIYESQDAGQSWIEANHGLPRLNIVSLAADWPGGVLYAAPEHDGVFKSMDLGKNWTTTGQPVLSSATILRLAVVPGTGTVLAGTSGAGVFSSTNQGGSWVQNLADRDQINDFTFNPGSNFVYAATSSGVFRSSDEGRTWGEIGQRAPYVLQLLVDPRNHSTVYAGTFAGRIYKSVDGGQEWNPAAAGLPPLNIFALGIDPKTGALYASPESAGVYRSMDGGLSWQPTDNSMIGDARISQLAVEPGSGDVYASTYGSSLYISRNGGDTWELFNLATNQAVFDIEFDPDNPGRIFISTTTGIMVSSDSGQSWRELGQQASRVYQVVSDPNDRSTIYVGSSAGRLYKSTDAGREWAMISASLPEWNIYSLAVDAASGTLFACPERQGLYASTNGGTDWMRLDVQGLEGVLVTNLTVVPGGMQFYAATWGAGLLRSSDGGQTWTSDRVGLESFHLSSVALDPLVANTIYASALSETGTEGGVSASYDAGETWHPITNGIGGVSTFQVLPSPDAAGRLFAATANGVYRTDDAGATWFFSGSGLETNLARVLAADVTRPGWYYAGTTNGLYYSTNGGAFWIAATSDFSNPVISSFAPGPDSNSFYAGTFGNGLFQTHNSGRTWQGGLDPQLTAPKIDALAQDPKLSDTLYALSAENGVIKSTDGGATWMQIGASLGSTNLTAILLDPGQTNRVFVGTSDQGVFVSQDGGATWAAAPSEFSSLNVSSIALAAKAGCIYVGTLGHGVLESHDGGTNLLGGILPELVNPVMLAIFDDPATPKILYAAIDPAGIIKSTDGGLTWRYSDKGLENVRIRQILVDPENSNRILAPSYGAGIFVSSDAGAHWTNAVGDMSIMNTFTVSAGGPDAFFAGTLGNGMVKSVDGGFSWSPGTAPELVRTFVLGVTMDPTSPDKVFAATSGTGIMISGDGGSSWSAANTGLDDLDVFATAVDPVDPRVVYAATARRGVYASENGGGSWSPLTNGMFNSVVTSLAIDVNDHRTIYAGTEGGGVFRLIRPPLSPTLGLVGDGPNLRLTWPSSSPMFTLEETPSLNPPAWTNAGILPVLTNQQYSITLTNRGGNAFYRLKESSVATPTP